MGNKLAKSQSFLAHNSLLLAAKIETLVAHLFSRLVPQAGVEAIGAHFALIDGIQSRTYRIAHARDKEQSACGCFMVGGLQTRDKDTIMPLLLSVRDAADVQ